MKVKFKQIVFNFFILNGYWQIKYEDALIDRLVSRKLGSYSSILFRPLLLEDAEIVRIHPNY